MQVKFKDATPERFSIFHAKRRMKRLDKRSSRRMSLRPFDKLQHAKESLIAQALKKAEAEELQDRGSCSVVSEF